MDYIDIVFDGPPSHESGRFVEVEDNTGKSIRIGEWIDCGNGLWALRIRGTDFAAATKQAPSSYTSPLWPGPLGGDD